ncbi:MAG: tRNA dimethylallyltransferase [Chloroflexota bacterium]|nr:tRNA dimethylallyltransferase [Chloroflexota bacterium]
MRESFPPLVVIAGATATGKTGLSLRLAQRLRADGIAAEIVSADSRQIYRGLDVGTAKVDPADRARVPHHGLDLVDPDQPFSVADYAEHVRGALAGIADRGGLAILVGGTGLYLRAIARGLATEALPSDAMVRSRIEAELRADGVAPLAARLRALAPGLAGRVDLANPRRVVRALEIAELAGDASLPPPRGYPGPVTWLGLSVAPAVHRGRIGERARGQFAAGLIEEARGLRERFDPARPAFSAIGYREAWAVLDGRASVDEAIEVDIARNVAFAKRQRTWFRAEPEIVWLDAEMDPDDPARAAVERFVAEA